MRFINTDKPYVKHAEIITPLYSCNESEVNEEVPQHRDIEFTGYKSPRCRIDFENAKIPMDGTWTMYNLHKDFDGYEGVFRSLFEMLDIDEVNVGLDPRARAKESWRVVRAKDAERIRRLCRIFGVCDHLWMSVVVAPKENPYE